MAAPTGNKNLQPGKSEVGERKLITHGPMTEATATLKGQHVGNFICPPGRRYAVRNYGFWVGTKGSSTTTGTGACILDIEKVALGTAAGSGVNLQNGADNTGIRAGSSTDTQVVNGGFTAGVIDDTEATGVNIINPGDRFYVETSGTLTALANIYAVLELEELPPLAGS